MYLKLTLAPPKLRNIRKICARSISDDVRFPNKVQPDVDFFSKNGSCIGQCEPEPRQEHTSMVVLQWSAMAFVRDRPWISRRHNDGSETYGETR